LLILLIEKFKGKDTKKNQVKGFIDMGYASELAVYFTSSPN